MSEFVLWTIAGFLMSLVPVVVVPVAGYVSGWLGALIVIAAAAVAGYCFGHHTDLGLSCGQKGITCASCGMVPLLLGAYYTISHPNDPIGTAYLILAFAAVSSAAIGTVMSHHHSRQPNKAHAAAGASRRH